GGQRPHVVLVGEEVGGRGRRGRARVVEDAAMHGSSLGWALDRSQGWAAARTIDAMADFMRLVTLCRELERTPARLEKLRLVARVVSGEMRTGVSDGLVLEAIAQVAAAPVGAVRRAALRLGDLSTVAVLAVTGGAAALAAASARPGVPLLPMLAETADDVDEALAAHRGRSALEFKYDGARIQLHRDGDRVAVWTRRLSDVTQSLPDVVAIAR